MAYDPNQPYKNVDGVNVNLTSDEIAQLTEEQTLYQQNRSAYDALPSTKAALAMASGVNITSTSTPDLNATYPIDQDEQAKIMAVSTYISMNNLFPGQSMTMPWFDMVGAFHVFPTSSLFKEFATAVADYVAAITIYSASNGHVGALPSNNITIS